MNDHAWIDSACYVLYKKFSAWIREAGTPIGFFLRDLREPTEGSEPTTRAYFRLPPPAGKAWGAWN